jgi:DNA invertase Pin-like site-specific DNA recombinase
VTCSPVAASPAERIDPTDPVDPLLFNSLAMVAEFEADLIRIRTREGMKLGRAGGRLRGKQPKLSRESRFGQHSEKRSGRQQFGSVLEQPRV